MPRPIDADSAQTYDGIIRAALSLLEEHGDAAEVGMRAISQRAGVSTGTIRYYFLTKEELFEACLDEFHGRVGGLTLELATRIGAGVEGAALIRWAARRAYRFMLDEPHLVGLRMISTARRGELHPRRQSEVLSAQIGALADLLAPHVGLTPIETRLAVLSLNSVCVRLARLTDAELVALIGASGEDGRRAVEGYFVDAALGVLRPPG